MNSAFWLGMWAFATVVYLSVFISFYRWWGFNHGTERLSELAEEIVDGLVEEALEEQIKNLTMISHRDPLGRNNEIKHTFYRNKDGVEKQIEN